MLMTSYVYSKLPIPKFVQYIEWTGKDVEHKNYAFSFLSTLEAQIYFVLEHACSVDFVSGIDLDVTSGSFGNCRRILPGLPLKPSPASFISYVDMPITICSYYKASNHVQRAKGITRTSHCTFTNLLKPQITNYGTYKHLTTFNVPTLKHNSKRIQHCTCFDLKNHRQNVVSLLK